MMNLRKLGIGELKIMDNKSIETNELLNKGYRILKIQEAEIKQLTNQVTCLKRYDEERDILLHRKLVTKTRKETAKEFSERVKIAFYEEFDELIPSIMANKIDEIYKEMAGEV